MGTPRSTETVYNLPAVFMEPPSCDNYQHDTRHKRAVQTDADGGSERVFKADTPVDPILRYFLLRDTYCDTHSTYRYFQLVKNLLYEEL